MEIHFMDVRDADKIAVPVNIFSNHSKNCLGIILSSEHIEPFMVIYIPSGTDLYFSHFNRFHSSYSNGKWGENGGPTCLGNVIHIMCPARLQVTSRAYLRTYLTRTDAHWTSAGHNHHLNWNPATYHIQLSAVHLNKTSSFVSNLLAFVWNVEHREITLKP